MEAIRTRKVKRVSKRARRGEFNLIWLIVAVIAVVMGVAIMYFVYTGGSGALGSTSTPALSAQASGGEVIVNIKNTGAGTLSVYNILLYNSSAATWSAYTSACSSYSLYLNGQTYTAPSSGPIASLKPGDTLTLICSTLTNEITEVQVQANTGTFSTVVT